MTHMLIWIINRVVEFVMLKKTNQQSDLQDTIGIDSLKKSANLSSPLIQGKKVIPFIIQWASTQFLIKRTSAPHDRGEVHFEKELLQSTSRNLLNTAKKVINIGQSVETEEESLVWPYIQRSMMVLIIGRISDKPRHLEWRVPSEWW